MTKIIGLNGKARSGKDSFVNIVENSKIDEDSGIEGVRFYKTSFAEPMRSMMCNILNIDLEELEKIKEDPHPILGGKTPRKALQTLGTEWGRDMVTTNLWTNSVKEKVNSAINSGNYDYVFITDVRFDNEAEMVKDIGGIVTKIVRPNIEIKESSHASEAGIKECLIDFTIMNDKDLESYTSKVIDFLKKM